MFFTYESSLNWEIFLRAFEITLIIYISITYIVIVKISNKKIITIFPLL